MLIANKLAPMLTAALRTREMGASSLTSLLASEARVVAERSLASLLTLRDLAGALDDAGVRWACWKGPALAVQAWADLGARSFSDLDIIVSPGDRERARAALVTAGWSSRHGMSRAQERAILSGSGALELARGADEPFVELHWRFASPRFPSSLRVAEVIARAERIALGGLSVLTPSGPDALVLLAMHGTKHGWSQAEEVLTFARLAWRDERAVEAAVRFALLARCSTPLGLAMALAERLAGLGLGTAARALAHTPRVAELAEQCVPRMCSGDAGWRPTHVWSLSWMDRRVDRFRYRARVLLTPTMEEWKWVRLPDATVSAYPAVRLARLAWRGLSPRR